MSSQAQTSITQISMADPLTQMTADHDRPYIYALQNKNNAYSWLAINTNTDTVEKTIPIGSAATDMSISYGEGKLYVSNWQTSQTRVINLATWTEETPLNLGSDVYKLNAGRPGRLYIEEEDQWVNLSVANSATGQILKVLFVREGDGEVDPTGNYYYHCDNNISNAHITKYDISTDNPQSVATSLEYPYGSRNLLLSPDGTRLFWRGYVYDQNLVELRGLGDEIYATTLHGELAISSSKVYDTATGQVIAMLPASSTVMAVSGDQKKFYFWTNGKLNVMPMSQIGSVSGEELHPKPADGATISLPLAQLAWDINPRAITYDVYIGTDAARVAAAGKGSAEFLGNTANPSIPLTMALTAGQTYYWRVDTVGFINTLKGSAWSFKVAPMTVGPQTLSFNVLSLAPTAQASLTLKGSSAAYTLSTQAPWLSVTPAQGTIPTTLTVRVNAAGMNTGSYATSIVVNCAGSSITVPVNLRVASGAMTQLLPDRERPYLYGLLQDSVTSDYFLAFINTQSDLTEKVLPIGIKATDMSISYGEGKLYVSNWQTPQTRVINLATWTEETPLSLGSDVYKLNAGRPGRLYTEGEDQWVNLSVRNSATGQSLKALNVREGDGEIDPTGNYYYHCDNNISDAHITKYDISTDAFQSVATSLEHPYGSRHLLLSPDGSRLFWRGYVYDQNLVELRGLGDEIYATTLHGELAISSTKAYDTATGQVLYTLPASSTVMAVSGNQKKLYYWVNNKLNVIPMDQIGVVSGQELHPKPADGATISLPLAQLAWDINPRAITYDVYIGTDAARVAAAGKGSAEFLGNTANPSIPLTMALTAGQTYYWRVDTVGFINTLKGSAWSFKVAPITVAPQALNFSVLSLAPMAQASLTLKGSSSAYTLSTQAPWLSVTPAQGTIPTTLTVRVNAAGMNTGNYATSITLHCAGSSITVPVNLRVASGAMTQLLPDRERPYLYGLLQDSVTSDYFLAFINTQSDVIEKVIPIGIKATDMSINYGEGKLYVSNWQTPQTRVINLATRTEETPLNLGSDVYKLNAGRPGRLYTEGEDQWVNLSVANSATGQILKVLFVREGDGEVDPTGNYYYHCDNNISNAHITKYDISTDNPQSVATSLEHPYGSRNLLLSPDGTRLFWRGYVYDQNLVELRGLGDEIYATTLHGELAISSSKVYDTATGQVIAMLPASSTVMAVSGDQKKFYYWANGKLNVVQTGVVSSQALHPKPANGATISQPLTQLAWDANAHVFSYDVYFGSDAAQVAAAGKNSAEFLGNTASPSIPLTRSLTAGQTYYWRVDTVGFANTLKGSAWSFQAAPITVAPQALSFSVLNVAPTAQASLALKGFASACTLGTNAPWLSVTPAQGTIPTTLTVRVNAAGMIAGSYATSITLYGAGSTIAVPVSLRVAYQAGITVKLASPALVILKPGQAVSMAVTATGAGPLSYQWLKNGVKLIGATQASMSIRSCQTGDDASYVCVVSGPAALANSPAIRLVVCNQAPLLNYLLGLTTNSAGLDENGDSRINVSDLLQGIRKNPPATPSAPSPASGGTVTSLKPLLNWADCSRAQSYDLYLWKASGSKPATPTAAKLSQSQWQMSLALDKATSYYWQVVAQGDLVNATGPVWSFKTP